MNNVVPFKAGGVVLVVLACAVSNLSCSRRQDVQPPPLTSPVEVRIHSRSSIAVHGINVYMPLETYDEQRLKSTFQWFSTQYPNKRNEYHELYIYVFTEKEINPGQEPPPRAIYERVLHKDQLGEGWLKEGGEHEVDEYFVYDPNPRVPNEVWRKVVISGVAPESPPSDIHK
jgi:hypothetical protein